MDKIKFLEAVKTSKNKREVITKLGLRAAGGNYKTFNKLIELWKVDISHFESAADRIKRTNIKRKIPLNEILVKNSSYKRTNLKRRLYKEGIKERKCEICGQGELWNGKKMSLILDHINGIWNDNRLENLRIVCPNCNATLDTHCAKNLKKKYYCSCGNEKSKSANVCRSCADKSRNKIIWPSKETLIKMVEETSFIKVSKKLGVSDNAIRKRINR